MQPASCELSQVSGTTARLRLALKLLLSPAYETNATFSIQSALRCRRVC